MSRQEWETPQGFVTWVESEILPMFGYHKFEVDVCAHAYNKKAYYYIGPPGAEMEDGCIGLNAFETDWLGSTRWCNPGFSNIEPWFARAKNQVLRFGGVVCILSHAQHSTGWHREAYWMSTMRVDINPRINFIPPPGIEPSSNTRDSHLWVITESTEPCRVYYPDPWR